MAIPQAIMKDTVYACAPECVFELAFFAGLTTRHSRLGRTMFFVVLSLERERIDAVELVQLVQVES